MLDKDDSHNSSVSLQKTFVNISLYALYFTLLSILQIFLQESNPQEMHPDIHLHFHYLWIDIQVFLHQLGRNNAFILNIRIQLLLHHLGCNKSFILIIKYFKVIFTK